MTDDERAIRDLIDRWHTATRTGDHEAVLGLMTDDAVFLAPGREPFGKEMFARMSREHHDVRIDGQSEVRELVVAGDWAFAISHLMVTMTPPGGNASTRTGAAMTIFRKTGGRWRLARDANLLAPPG